MLRIHLPQYEPGDVPAHYRNISGSIEVEPGEDGCVLLTLVPDEGGPRRSRELEPAQARALSAALLHYAAEGERR